MKYIFLYLTGAIIFMGCSENKSAEEKEQLETSKKKQPQVENNKVEIELLSKKRDSLLTYFDFKKVDFIAPSYYNKAWPKQYWMREHILMAGLDSAGNYFLTMTTFFPAMNYLRNNDSVEVVVYLQKDSVATTKAHLEKDSLLIKFEDFKVFIGTWNPLFKVYDKNACSEVMKFIYANRTKNINFILTDKGKEIDGPHSVGQRSRDAISQCYELGVVLDELKKLNENGNVD